MTSSGPVRSFDFSRNFLPESLARTAELRVADGGRAARPQPYQRAPIFAAVRDRRAIHHPRLARSQPQPVALGPGGTAGHPQFRRRGSQAHPLVRAVRAGLQPAVPGEMRNDRPLRGNWRRSASPPAGRRRTDHPDVRMDEPDPLCRQRQGRRRHRPLVQEHAQASLDRGGPARKARHFADRLFGRGPHCSRPRGGDRRLSRYRRLLRRGPEGTGRPQSRRARRTGPAGRSRIVPRSTRSSTRPPAGPIWDRV